MENFKEARDNIFREITSDDAGVRAEFLEHFSSEMKTFSEKMGRAVVTWRLMDSDLKGDNKRAGVSALVFTAIDLHIVSMKLFVSGYSVAAGNLSRQTVETISLAIVCSKKELGILDRFLANKYSTSDAVRDALRYSKKLGLHDDGIIAIKQAREFYHSYSHPSKMTIANLISFSHPGTIYMGANFDQGKIDAYRKEINNRVRLSMLFCNFIDGVKNTVAKW